VSVVIIIVVIVIVVIVIVIVIVIVVPFVVVVFLGAGSQTAEEPAQIKAAEIEPARHARQPAEPTHGLGLKSFDPRGGVVEGGQPEVLEHLDVVWVHHLGIDGDRPELQAPGDLDPYHAPARLPFHGGVHRLFLGHSHLLLHLHRRAEQRSHVEATTAEQVAEEVVHARAPARDKLGSRVGGVGWFRSGGHGEPR